MDISKPFLIPENNSNYLQSNILTQEEVSKKVSELILKNTIYEIIKIITEYYIDEDNMIINGKIFGIVYNFNKNELNILLEYFENLEKKCPTYKNIKKLFIEKYRIKTN